MRWFYLKVQQHQLQDQQWSLFLPSCQWLKGPKTDHPSAKIYRYVSLVSTGCPKIKLTLEYLTIFSSAHFGRTLESTLSVTDVMMTFTQLGYLSKYFCPYLSKYFCPYLSKYFFQKLCNYFWSKIVQIFLIKNCANILGQKLCKYIWSKIVQIFLLKIV